jgi:antitoxin MazE
MRAKLQRWGNSLAVRISKGIAQDLEVAAGDTVDLRVEDRELVIRPIPVQPPALEDLLSKITPDNLHAEIETGAPRGREAW